MGRIWRFVGFSVMTLLVAGLLLAGTGLLTGASTERVSAVLSGEFESLRGFWQQARGFFAGYLPS